MRTWRKTSEGFVFDDTKTVEKMNRDPLTVRLFSAMGVGACVTFTPTIMFRRRPQPIPTTPFRRRPQPVVSSSTVWRVGAG